MLIHETLELNLQVKSARTVLIISDNVKEETKH